MAEAFHDAEFSVTDDGPVPYAAAEWDVADTGQQDYPDRAWLPGIGVAADGSPMWTNELYVSPYEADTLIGLGKMAVTPPLRRLER